MAWMVAFLGPFCRDLRNPARPPSGPRSALQGANGCFRRSTSSSRSPKARRNVTVAGHGGKQSIGNDWNERWSRPRGMRLGACEVGTVLFGEERCALVLLAASAEQLSKLTGPPASGTDDALHRRRRRAPATGRDCRPALPGACPQRHQVAITSAASDANDASDANASGATRSAGSLASPRQPLRSRPRPP
jgi:hypothetical protein